MKKKKQVNLGFAFLMLILLLIVMSVVLYFQPVAFTGFVVSPVTGEECDGDWTCGEWSECADGNQTRECTSENSVNCTSPITETQACVSCTENWTCGEWDECVNDTQTRICEDTNTCGTEDDKPELLQACVSCTENWTCTDWTECADSSQTRTCTDSAECGTTTTKPEESQVCTMPAVCGDDSCNGDEDCDSCSEDCGECEEETTTEETTIIQETETSSSDEEIHTTVISCSSDWQCGEWSECINELQNRECSDANNCGTEEGRPELSQSCTPPETCFDKIKNQDEQGIDCGGVCEKKCSVFTIVGSVIRVPIDSGKQFFKNNTIASTFILGGVVVAIGGFVAFKFFLKGKFQIKGKKKDIGKKMEDVAED